MAEELDQILAAARAAWPGVVVPDEVFLAHLRRHAPVEHGTDLYLACACARGDTAAIALLDRRLLPRIDKAVARIDPSPTLIDDVRQEVRCRLLVGPSP